MSSLPADVQLYARVGARVDGAWLWGGGVTFRAIRATAALTYPTANATGVLPTQSFEWTAAPGADAYILHIGTAPDTWDVVAAGLLTQRSYRVNAPLPLDRTLYARVGARVGGVWWWAPSIPFTAARITPAIVYPVGDTTDISTSRDFEWSASPGADAYILHIGTAPNTSDVLAAGLLTGTTFRVTTLLPSDRTLYMRVGARVGGTWWWSASVPFRAVRATATLIYPVANATNTDPAHDLSGRRCPMRTPISCTSERRPTPGTWSRRACSAARPTT